MYRQIIITYRPIARIVPNNLFSTVYSMSPSHLPTLTSPCRTNGTATEKRVCARSAYVHMKKQFCAHFCGLPLTGSMFNARMRAPMKSTASIGAKFMLAVAVINAFSTLLVKPGNRPVNWVQLRAICMPPYTRKYWHARIIVHCTAGATGNFLPSGQVPAGGTKVIMPYTTPRAPTYNMRRMMYFSTVKAIAQAWLLNGSASSGICPGLGST